jgi:Flp pilus assembly pilin Flp
MLPPSGANEVELPEVTGSQWQRLARLAARVVAELVADERGAMTTEYVVLVGTVSLLVVGALVSVGPLLLNSYEKSRAVLIGPFP